MNVNKGSESKPQQESDYLSYCPSVPLKELMIMTTNLNQESRSVGRTLDPVWIWWLIAIGELMKKEQYVCCLVGPF
jgi:hypothetical protein